MVAIKDCSGPHHVRPGFRPRHDRRAVRQVHNPRIDPQGAQALERGVKTPFLFACLLANGGIRENFRRSKVRKNTGKLHVLALSQLPCKAIHLAGRNAQPVHSCIDLQMEGNRFLTAAPRRRPIQ